MGRRLQAARPIRIGRPGSVALDAVVRSAV